MSNTVNPKENTNQLEAFFEQLVKQVKFSKWFFGAIHALNAFGKAAEQKGKNNSGVSPCAAQ